VKRLLFPALAGLSLIAGPAHASNPGWNWSSGPACPDAPRDKWMTFEGARTRAAALGYEPRIVLVARGCYEVYGFDKNGAKSKFSLHPVSGEIVRENLKQWQQK